MRSQFTVVAGLAIAISCSGPAGQQPAAPPATAEPSTGLSAARIAQIETMIADEVARRRYPSLAAGVIHGGKLVWHAGYGSRTAAGEPVTGDTVLRIGSVTKVLTATAILQLRDAGKLRLEDRAATYIPEAATVLSPAGADPVTVQHLVMHTSGIPSVGNGSLNWATGDHDITEAELLGALRNVELEFSPGSEFAYSNVGMALAGLIVARASDEPYRDYVNQHILAPLGMTSSYWDRAAVPASRLADGHWRRGEGEYGAGGPHWRLGAMEPAGGLYSTVEDMARFAAFALRASEHDLDIGWRTTQHPILGKLVWHNGSTFDYGAWLGVAPAHDLAFVALLGTGHLDELEQLASLGTDVLEALADPSEPSPTPPAAIEASMTRVVALIGAADEPRVVEAFSPAYLASSPAAKLVAFFASVGTKSGACAGYQLTRDRGRGRFRARVRCDRGHLDADVHVQIDPPHLIDGLLIKRSR